MASLNPFAAVWSWIWSERANGELKRWEEVLVFPGTSWRDEMRYANGMKYSVVGLFADSLEKPNECR